MCHGQDIKGPEVLVVSNSGFIDILTEQVKTLEALEIQNYESALKYWIYKIMIFDYNYGKLESQCCRNKI